MTFRPKSFKKIESICKRSNLSPFVKHLVYEADLLPRVEHKAWMAGVGHDFTDQALDRKMLDCKYRAYMREIDSIKHAITNNIDFVTLDHAFKQFSNIERVDLCLSGIYPSGSLGGCESTTIKAAFQDVLIPPHLLIRHVLFYGEYDPSNHGVRQLKSILLAIAASGAKLKDLRCGLFDWSFFGQNTLGEVGHCKNFAEAPELYLPAFTHLVNLSLAIQPSSSGTSVQNRRIRNLGKALSASKNLKKLKCKSNQPAVTFNINFNRS